MEKLFSSYDQFLTLFTANWHGPISLLLVLIVAAAIWQVIRKSGVWLVLLVILIPSLLPILKNLGKALIELLKFLINRSST